MPTVSSSGVEASLSRHTLSAGRRARAGALPRRVRADRSGRGSHSRSGQPTASLNLTPRAYSSRAARLRTEFAALLGGRTHADVVHHCGSGVTACANILAMEIAGLSGTRLYPGSWSEWIAKRERPVAKAQR